MLSINFTSVDKTLKSFSPPFLLALSGGPDSMALFHVLLELKIPFGVAHVDHRWRRESAEEAKQLQAMAEKAGVPFHLKVLDPSKLAGNLEQACRDERLKFFSSLPYTGVILGHHQDDLAETVLKRILEGASISGWVAMEPVSKWEGLTLLRPWLQVPKKEILAFLHERKIPYFTDATNSDPKFLRAKMRLKMIPEIEGHFGKSIRAPLTRLSKECSELNAFMNARWASKLKKKDWLDCGAIKTPFEIRYVVKHWLKAHGFEASYAVLDDITEALLSDKSDLCFNGLEVDRKRLFLRRCFKEENPPPILLTEGKHRWGIWSVEVRKKRSKKEKIGWQNALKGNLKIFLPKGQFYLGSASKEEKRKYQSKWSEAKVPPFLRRVVPVISGKRDFFLNQPPEQDLFFEVVLSIVDDKVDLL